MKLQDDAYEAHLKRWIPMARNWLDLVTWEFNHRIIKFINHGEKKTIE